MCVKLKTSYMKLFCCVLSLFLLLLVGCISASADSILNEFLVPISYEELFVSVDGYVRDDIYREGRIQNTVYPSLGDVLYRELEDSQGVDVNMGFRTLGEFVIPAESKVYLRFLVMCNYDQWPLATSYNARMYDSLGREVLRVDNTNSGSQGCSISEPTRLERFFDCVLVSFYYDNSLNSSDVTLTEFQFEWLYSSSLWPVCVGSSGCLVQTVGDPALAEKYPSVDTSEADKLEEDERELLAGISDGRDIGNNILSGMSGNVMTYSATLAAISAFMADIVGVHGSVSMLVQMSAAIGIACVVIGAGFSVVGRLRNK